ncbi:MAG: ABC transporter permease [Phycisphaerae bacterium]|nr:ABC transporter permease [Phycisphaerae bacterium]
MNAVIRIAMKDLRLLVRDKADAFFTFVFPLLIALFFGYVFGGGGGEKSAMPVAVVNEDGGASSKWFVEQLSKAGGIEAKPAETREAGERLVRRGEAAACVIVPQGFEDSTKKVFSGGGMRLEAIVDPKRSAEAGLLEGRLNELGFRLLSRAFTDSSMMNSFLDSARQDVAKSAGLSPLQKGVFGTFFDSVSSLTKEVTSRSTVGDTNDGETRGGESKEGAAGGSAGDTGGGFRPVTVTMHELQMNPHSPNNSFAVSFPQGVVWGLMGCVMAFGVSLVQERRRGTLLRLCVAPITKDQILLGKAAACFASCVIVQVILLVVARLMGVKIGHPAIMAAAVLASSVGFTGVMMLLAGLSKSEGAAQGFGRALLLVLALIGGGSIPLFFMPKLMQQISSVSPFKWATIAIENGLWRADGWDAMLLPGGVLLSIGVIGFWVGRSAMVRSRHSYDYL